MRQAVFVIIGIAAILAGAVLFVLKAHSAEPPQATRIETDQKTGAVEIIANGKEVARFDAKGLHVRDGIEYGGEITDTGVSSYDKRVMAEPKH